MVTVIANQKRTLAVEGSAIPCTFDPLDGNAGLWIQGQPCVAQVLVIRLTGIPSYDIEGIIGTYRIEEPGQPVTFVYLNTPRQTHTTNGSGYGEIFQSHYDYQVNISAPVWNRYITRIGIISDSIFPEMFGYTTYVGPGTAGYDYGLELYKSGAHVDIEVSLTSTGKFTVT